MWKFRSGLVAPVIAVVIALPSVCFSVVAIATQVPDGFEEQEYVSGLALPTSMTFAPDGRLFICEKAGNLRVVQNGVLLPTLFLSLNVASNSERGLLGVAFDPDFETNRYLYVYYTRATDPIKNRISRFTASATDPNQVEPGSEVVILDDIASDAGNHNGGVIQFGRDRKLYVGVGDGGANAINGQSLDTLSGKLLRIDPATFPNIVPSDNPFVGTPDARGEIWAWGLRNPFTFAFQPSTDELFVNDVGQNAWEEVNRIFKGANYGWPEAEGISANPNFENPIYTYPHDQGGASITGGAFYEAGVFPPLYDSRYFFADYVLGFIRYLSPPDYTQASDFALEVPSPVDLKVGPDGQLYYLSFFQGRVYRIAYIGDANRTPVAQITANQTSGAAPLVVRFQGTESTDPEGDSLSYAWDFGDGSPIQTGAIAIHSYPPGQYIAQLHVTDSQGASDIASTTITSGSTPPVGQISVPVRPFYTAGTLVSFGGIATDLEDGELPPSALSWRVIFHHANHTHPFLGPLVGTTGGNFIVPTTGETAANVFYRIELTATDSSGLTHISTRDIAPRTTRFQLRTEPAGLKLTLDGQPIQAPDSILGVAGMQRTLGAPLEQAVNGISYEFVGWSNGGDSTHTITTPLTPTSYTATYQAKP